ncbi:MAG: hypothetical protein KC912_12475 [Proteobacteria bacterium]|nr:hypothetical protein [Pseudomonadota bacterium]
MQLELDAEADVQGHPDIVSRPVLVISCVSKKLAVYVRTPDLRPELNADEFDSFMTKTRQQLDDEPAANQFMRKDIMEETLHFRRARPALRTLMEHQRLIFAFQPFGSDPVQTTFDLHGLSEAATALECRT